MPSLIQKPYHAGIMKEILFALYGIEQLRYYGETRSAVIVLEDGEDCKRTENSYRLSSLSPEMEERFRVGEEEWIKRVYVIDDAGNGIVSFERTSPRAKK